MFQRTIGIDLAIRGDHVAQIFDHGQPAGKPIRFRLTPQSLRSFLDKVRAGLPNGAQVQAVLEPTGMAWFPVALWLTRAGIGVIRVKGQRVKALRRYLSEYAKTDPSDAYVLGAIANFGGPTLEPVFVPGPEQHTLRRLTKQRERYQDALCASKRRLLDLIRWACPALEAVLPDLRTRLSRAVLSQYFDPRRVLATKPGSLIRFIARHAAGNQPRRGPFVEDLAGHLRAAAHETLALVGEAVDFDALQFEVGQEIAQLELLDQHIGELSSRIDELYTRLHPSDALRTIPGIGTQLAPVLFALLHTPQHFRNERQVRGFCGLFPKRRASGGVERPGQKVTKSGHDRLKRALYLAADAARRVDPGLAEVYWRLMVHKGHHHKQALCAVATRLINRICAVFRTGRAYELRDPEGRSISVTEGRQIIAARFTVPEDIRRGRRQQRAAA
jgi:transposase